MLKILGDENFQETISKGYWLVDFYADWCGPCKMLGEVLKEINEIDILKVNVDTHQAIAAQFGVMSIPTLVFMHNGKIVKQEMGFIAADEIKRIITEIKKVN